MPTEPKAAKKKHKRLRAKTPGDEIAREGTAAEGTAAEGKPKMPDTSLKVMEWKGARIYQVVEESGLAYWRVYMRKPKVVDNHRTFAKKGEPITEARRLEAFQAALNIIKEKAPEP